MIGIGNVRVNPRFHPMLIGWHVGLTPEFPTPTISTSWLFKDMFSSHSCLRYMVLAVQCAPNHFLKQTACWPFPVIHKMHSAFYTKQGCYLPRYQVVLHIIERQNTRHTTETISRTQF